MSVGALLAAAGLALCASLACAARFPRAWLALVGAGAVAGLAAALAVLAGASAWEWRCALAFGGEGPHLRVDGLSAVFLALQCAVGGAGAAYSREYWSDRERPESAPRGRAWWSAMQLAMASVLVCSNGLHFLISWELFALCAYFLITLEHEHREVRRAGWLYLAASHAGTLCLFAFFAGLASRTGSWDLGPMGSAAELAPLYWLALFGFAVKAGLFPLHVWLPSAHAGAPSHVSALMSGVAIKLGVYGIARFGGWMALPAAAPWVLLGLGTASAVLGIAFALAQNDLKRLLAYSSVENVGIVAVGLGGALLASARGHAPWGRLLLAGALLHVWNHGLFKSLLFLGAGSVLQATGTRELSRLGGLWRAMPWTAAAFAAGALAVCALPPFNGFAGEWLLYLGLFDAAASGEGLPWAAVPALALALAGALALASFAKASGLAFLGAARTRAAAAAHESGAWMRTTMALLAAVCLLLGLWPLIAWRLLSTAVGAWNPRWSGAEPPAPLATLGAAEIALALCACAGAALLWRRARASSAARGPTWDCGFAAPSARMQYTGGSFAGIAAAWFGWIVRFERRQRRPRGPFPAEASRIERVPEAVLEGALHPVGRAVLRLSGAVRGLQHGRLQSYIVYLLGGLALLALLAAAGGGAG